MSNTRSVTISANGFNTILFFLLLTLKLCHVISWSWWWIFAPFWVPVLLFILALPVAILLAARGKKI